MGPRVIVIGAGWAGLSSARTYLRLNPSADLTILDDDTSVGGVWSHSRIYPGLIADSPRGGFEYTDLSMLDEDIFASSQKNKRSDTDNQAFGLIRGDEVHNYLYKYAEKYDLLRRTKFQSRVVKAERIPLENTSQTGWRLTLSSGSTLDCDKLIVASGLYSQPYIPHISGLPSFGGISMHSKYLGTQHTCLADPSIKTIVVVGGCKSALETINLCLSLPQKPTIHWITRGSYYGVPIMMNDPNMKVNIFKITGARLFSSLSPSVFDTSSWAYRTFHSGTNWLGSRIESGFWKLMAWASLRDTQYDSSEQGKMIKPDPKRMFRSLLHVSLIHKGNPVVDEIHSGARVKLHIGEIGSLNTSSLSITTPSGEKQSIDTDAVIWCTGWKSSTSFFSAADTAALGLPVPVISQTPETQKHWAELYKDADAQVLRQLPDLAKWPIEQSKEDTTNYRLYRQITSPRTLASADRSIFFAGFVSNAMTAVVSELVGLWGVAWMEGLLRPEDLPQEAEMEKSVAKGHAWMARRYGARANTQPEIVFEIQTFMDALVRDLGGKAERKGGGWREWVSPYSARDYEGLFDEVVKGKGRAFGAEQKAETG
ncbi:FAD/NAD(P)-binding domain-containing protein [Lophiostoma macrostomum CBS 122681]|uniref:FAD/NAD(P)-binding domain-containing protein n=1 Tax=Lophiostoma macrostomum CBS 122681 TaxID=1314788 RepID=A0A6A6T9S5_9PLEO|nr:FAD/NAD(P)-binding domain-containing protein [Lophiostoma macrostomum CBS 122681]